jgi:hypothetical protein
MYKVHKFMNLNFAENTYFITQVGLAAASFGVAEEDIAAVAEALSTLFNVRCAPPTAVIPDQGEQLHSICIDEETCPLAENATCELYEKEDDEECPPTSTPAPTESAIPPPPGGNSTAIPTSAPTPSPTGDNPPAVPTGGAAVHGIGSAAVAAGFAALLL